MQILLVTLLLGAALYSILAILAAARYRGARPAEIDAKVPISVLKPVAGLDSGLESNLRTFFEQDYPAFELLFAAANSADPAIAVIEKLQAEYPHVPSRVIITGRSPYANAKVYSLDRMLRAASHELIVMSDSDTRVDEHLLRTIAREFQDPKLGVATCPYRARACGGWWSRLETTGMNTDFLSGVLVARLVEGMRFALGPTIAARRAAIDSIGGLDRLKDYLAEDFMLGRLVSDAGFRVILSSYVIEHHIADGDWRENAVHRLRWVRSTRRSRPLGYAGQLFTMTLPLALAVAIVAPGWWMAALGALALRLAAAYVVSRSVLRTRIDWLLLPIEDLMEFVFWIAGFFGSTVEWRGRRYRIRTDGRFEPVPEEPAAIPAVSIVDEP